MYKLYVRVCFSMEMVQPILKWNVNILIQPNPQICTKEQRRVTMRSAFISSHKSVNTILTSDHSSI